MIFIAFERFKMWSDLVIRVIPFIENALAFHKIIDDNQFLQIEIIHLKLYKLYFL